LDPIYLPGARNHFMVTVSPLIHTNGHADIAIGTSTEADVCFLLGKFRPIYYVSVPTITSISTLGAAERVL
jgi:hypothetical protein